LPATFERNARQGNKIANNKQNAKKKTHKTTNRRSKNRDAFGLDSNGTILTAAALATLTMLPQNNTEDVVVSSLSMQKC